MKRQIASNHKGIHEPAFLGPFRSGLLKERVEQAYRLRTGLPSSFPVPGVRLALQCGPSSACRYTAFPGYLPNRNESTG
jgi:hypothetical protein